MPKYGVNLYTTASVHVEVEADDPEAAIEGGLRSGTLGSLGLARHGRLGDGK